MIQIPPQAFPLSRPRRLRQAPFIRNLVREHDVTPNDLILPLFVHEKSDNAAVSSMPGVFRHSLASLVETAKRAHARGIPAVAVFPVIDGEHKSDDGKLAVDENNLVCRAVRAIKNAAPDVGVICDVALDPFTTHGHDGLFENGDVHNDRTLEVLIEQAVVQAKAGCDVLAPSDMMDGRVGAIRKALEASGHHNTLILSYAVKYASAFYGPFRDAVGSKGNLQGASKATYQMDPGNADEALREVALDLSEGADLIMVKPGLPYLDILRLVSETFPVPTFAYQVSGEYSMLHASHQLGWLDYPRAMRESLLCLKRAGASAILTYAALEIAESL